MEKVCNDLKKHSLKIIIDKKIKDTITKQKSRIIS